MTWDIAYAIVFAGMAAFGAADLLVNQAGPGDILARLRVRFGAQARWDGSSRPPTRFVTGVLSCVYCASFWLALAFTGLVGASVLVWEHAWPVVFPMCPLAGYGIAAVMVGRVTTRETSVTVSGIRVTTNVHSGRLGNLMARVLYLENLPYPGSIVPFLDMEDQYLGLGPYDIQPDAKGEARRRGAWLTRAMAAWPAPTPAPDDDPTPDPAIGSAGHVTSYTPGTVSTAPAYDPKPAPRAMVVQDANFDEGVYRVEDGHDEDGAMNIARFHGHAAYDRAMEWGAVVDWLLAGGPFPPPNPSSIDGDPINRVGRFPGGGAVHVEETSLGDPSDTLADAFFFGPDHEDRAKLHRSRRINRNTLAGCVNCHGAGWIFAPWLDPKGILCNACDPG